MNTVAAAALSHIFYASSYECVLLSPQLLLLFHTHIPHTDKRTHSSYRAHILHIEHTFYIYSTHSTYRAHIQRAHAPDCQPHASILLRGVQETVSLVQRVVGFRVRIHNEGQGREPDAAPDSRLVSLDAERHL